MRYYTKFCTLIITVFIAWSFGILVDSVYRFETVQNCDVATGKGNCMKNRRFSDIGNDLRIALIKPIKSSNKSGVDNG